ncbi:hypothetical protein FOL46_001074 [Perkinsus olseni]|uniref:Uncharacterized protein n=1 Tax=Perkinsus olseni TaxID=32597 RepID=A0A7J6MW35_PEROL|nr:hypothetical protein FOL46_001074 [Perkinsus olseni]
MPKIVDLLGSENSEAVSPRESKVETVADKLAWETEKDFWGSPSSGGNSSEDTAGGSASVVEGSDKASTKGGSGEPGSGSGNRNHHLLSFAISNDGSMPVIVPAEDLPVVEALKEKVLLRSSSVAGDQLLVPPLLSQTTQPTRPRAASVAAKRHPSVGMAVLGRARRASEGTYEVPAGRSLRWCLDDCEDSSEGITEREKEPPEGPLIEAEGVDPVGWDAEGSVEEEVRRAVASVEEACQPSSAMVPSGADEQHSVGCQNSNGEATIVETSSFEMPSGRLDEHAHAESGPPVGVVERSFDSKGEGNVTSSRSDDVAMEDSSPVSTLSLPQGRPGPPTSLLVGGERPCDATDDSDWGIVRDDLKQRPSEIGGDLSVPSGDLEEVLQDFSATQYAPCPRDDAVKPCSPESAVSLLRSSPEAESTNEVEPLPQAAVITVVTTSWDKSDDDRDSVISSDGGDIDWEAVKSRAKVRILRAIQVLLAVLALQVFPPLLLYIDPPDLSRN